MHQSGIRASVVPAPLTTPVSARVNGLATGQMPYALAATKSSTCGHHSQHFCLARQQSEARPCVRVGSVHLLPIPYTTTDHGSMDHPIFYWLRGWLETPASRTNAYWPMTAPAKEAQA